MTDRARTCTLLALLLCAASVHAAPGNRFNDAHFHLTDWVQEGITAHELLTMMGKRVARSTLFGIPLQQHWSHRDTGDRAPRFYLDTDAPLYYYSFTDAVIAEAYLALAPAERARLDPMITGFNPADMYAADHVRRVLDTYPGVFSGIGEFTIEKAAVSSRVAGERITLDDPALDRLLDFAADVGLVVSIHVDIDGARAGDRAYLAQAKALFARHPDATFIWAHTGFSGALEPIEHHLATLDEILDDRSLAHVSFDLSWDRLADLVVGSSHNARLTAQTIERHPDRFLFGTDHVAPPDRHSYFAAFDRYRPLWNALSPRASELVRSGNYERIFDAARRDVRKWEKNHVR
jgi:hypothetical protein